MSPLQKGGQPRPPARQGVAHKPCSNCNTKARVQAKKYGDSRTWRDIQVPGLREVRQLNERVGGSLFVEKVLQNRFGVDADEFFSEGAMEQVDIAGMDAIAVMNHCEP